MDLGSWNVSTEADTVHCGPIDYTKSELRRISAENEKLTAIITLVCCTLSWLGCVYVAVFSARRWYVCAFFPSVCLLVYLCECAASQR